MTAASAAGSKVVSAQPGSATGASTPFATVNVSPFLWKTWNLVSDPSSNHIISWSAEGRTFTVWQPDLLEVEHLPNTFKHSNFASFVRQLNNYGFRKCHSDRFEFGVEGFEQGKPELLTTLRRHDAPRSKKSGGNDGGGGGGGGAADAGGMPSFATQQDIVDSLGGDHMYSNHIRAIQMAANSIHAVLNDTLDLYKYTLTGQLSMSPRPFDFLRAVEETVEEARAAEFGGGGGGGGGGDAWGGSWRESSSSPVSLRCDVDPAAAAELLRLRREMGAREIGDEQRLRQVLMNLMSNACRHTPAGGSVVVTFSRVQTVWMSKDDTDAYAGAALSPSPSPSPSQQQLTSTASNSPNSRSGIGSAGAGKTVGLVRLEVTVTDTGCGITERDQKALFTPYGSNAASFTGSSASGIGLALSQLIVGQHGGKIKVSSEVGVGSTFSLEVNLPLVRLNDNDNDDGNSNSNTDADNNIDNSSSPELGSGGMGAPGWGCAVNEAGGSGGGGGAGAADHSRHLHLHQQRQQQQQQHLGPQAHLRLSQAAVQGGKPPRQQQFAVARSSGWPSSSLYSTHLSPSPSPSPPPSPPRTRGNSDNGGGGGVGGWGDANDYRKMQSDLANGAAYCTDGADRAARTSMKRGSWEGKRPPANPYNAIMGYPPLSTGAPSRVGVGVGAGELERVSSILEEHDRSSGVMELERRRGGFSASASASGSGSGGVPVARRQPRVLLVDDDRLVRMVLGALLRRLGAECETACHGIDAIEKVRSFAALPDAPDGAAFDLIVMDVRMPQMNGMEATRILRSGGCTTPIVGLTANTLPEDTASFLKSGATEVLYKPMSAESAGMLLRRYLPRAALGAA